jgi:acyl-CoA thioester hydrolase
MTAKIFEKQERVYYEDTDAGGVVYHSNYLNFMERCRCEWLSSIGYDIADVQENHGVIFVVREADIKFDLPARLFDNLRVTVQALQVGKVKLVVEQKIYNQDQLLCRAQIKLASLQHSSFTLAAMPQELQTAFKQQL